MHKPPNKAKNVDVPKKTKSGNLPGCKVGKKRCSIRKTFKTGSYGSTSKVKKGPPPPPPGEAPDTHTNPNRMSGSQVNIPGKISKKDVKAKLRYLKSKKKAGESTSTLMQGSY